MSLDRDKAALSKLHDKGGSPMRWGYRARGTTNSGEAGCYFPIRVVFNFTRQHNGVIYTVFHGDGLAVSFQGLVDPEKYHQELAEYTQPWDKFVGTPRSRKWVEFLTGKNSPWRALIPFIAEPDLDFINENGFIFTNLKEIPAALWYCFLMAIRNPWELPKNYSLWLLLTEERKMEPALAAFIAQNYQLAKGATSLEGPYDIVYPWSFLEGCNLEAAGRFILGEPRPIAHFQDNLVNALWAADTPDNKTAFTKLERETELSLTTIQETVLECVHKQKESF